MLGALFLGLFCGIVARMFVPGEMFRRTSSRRACIHCHGGRPQAMT
jgi:hypothetical protein